jgi:Mannosyltransferase (PIG-V)
MSDASAVSPISADARSRLPLWARLADALALAGGALWLRIALVGPVREKIGGVLVTASTQLRVLAFVALVLAVRHAVWPRPALHERIWSRVRLWHGVPYLGAVVTGALASRVLVLLVGIVALSAFGVPRGASVITTNPVRNMVARWDAYWYLSIADRGYEWQPDGQQHNVAFFPAFPVAMAVLAAVLRWHLLHAGLLLSVVAFALAAAYLYRLARETLDAEQALAAVWLLAAYPFAVYFSAPYSESVYLLAAVGALYHFGRDEWGYAAAWGAVAGLTRPNGCLLSVVLAIAILTDLWRRRRVGLMRSPRELARQLASASAPGLGLVAYSAYLQARFGHPLLWLKAHGAWGRTYTDMGEFVSRRAATLADIGPLTYLYSHPYDVLNFAAAAFGLAMIVPVWRRLGAGPTAFVVLSLVPPLVMGGTLSMGRLTSTVFPIFIVLGAVRRPAWRMGLLATFAMLQGLVAVLFFTWRPMF